MTLKHPKMALQAAGYLYIITMDPYEAADTVIYLSEAEAQTLAYGEFYRKYYIGSTELEYSYQIVPLDEVKEMLTSYGGVGKVKLANEQWTVKKAYVCN